MNTKQLKRLRRMLGVKLPRTGMTIGRTRRLDGKWFQYKLYKNNWKAYPGNKKHYYWSDLEAILRGAASV